MLIFLRSVRALSLALWVGGIFFFALGVAPVAFHVLPSTHAAGSVVGASLLVLHRLGFTCAAVYLLSVALSYFTSRETARTVLLPTILVWLMLVMTTFLHFALLPRMEADRSAAGGSFGTQTLAAPARIDFDRLHSISEQLEGTILLLGFVALVMGAASAESTAPSTPVINSSDS